LTETGAVLGTPSYMAPEQAVGSKRGTLGPPTDVYGLGATLYELLTGQAPFRGASTFETLQRVINDAPVPPRRLNPAVHPDLNAVCLKCLEKDPARRYATAQELANDLHRWRIGDPTRARPLTLRRRVWRGVRRRAKWFAAVGVIAAAVAVGIYIAMERPPNADDAMKTLRRGEAVTLIGETGAPKYHRWVVGVGEAAAQGAGKPFMAFATEIGLLELVPDSQTERFRFSAEFRVDASADWKSTAGIYFAHRQSLIGGGVAVDRAVVVDFTDNCKEPAIYLKAPQKNGQPNRFDQVTVRDVLYYVPPISGGLNESSYPLGHLRVVDPLNEDGGKKRDPFHWRQIVATVTPDELRVEWREPDGTYRPVGPSAHGKTLPVISMNIMPTRDLDYRLLLKQTFPNIETDGLVPYSSRGGIGLYVHNARVFFRNVVVEPLP
ncbi:MAG TPA: protein kinase, partial [Gemmata sp.]|nr:protein kinase [Gemmata sp.]